MSHLEDLLLTQIRACRLPEPEREYRFTPPRQFRFDFAWPGILLAVEVEGGLYVYGRHQRPQTYQRDCSKYNLAVRGGWRVLRFTGEMIESGEAINTLTEWFPSFLAGKEDNNGR